MRIGEATALSRPGDGCTLLTLDAHLSQLLHLQEQQDFRATAAARMPPHP